MSSIRKWVAAAVAWTKKLFIVRVIIYYGSAQGALLASGLAYQAIFAIFAALWVGFSILGLVVAGDAELQQPVITAIANAVPGLIKTSSSSSGAIDPSVLLSARSFTITGIIALVGVLVTALGWLSSARSAIRIIFGVPQSKTNFLLLKLRDLIIAIGFGVLMIVSAALSVAGTAATGFGLGLIGVSRTSFIAAVIGKVVTIALSILIDIVIFAGLFRALSGVSIPFRRLVGGVVVGAVALAALTVLGGSLLGVSKNNPLLASFAVILGLLIFFNFVCQIILISASWVSVALADRGLELGEMDRRRRPDVEP